MNITVGEKPPLIAVGGAMRALAAARSGIDIDREDFDALDHHQPLAVVVRPGLDARIGTIAPRHRPIDRIVDVAFDDEEAGEAAGDLIVRGAVRVRVIPVRAGRMRLRRRARPARRFRGTFPSGCSYSASPTRSCGARPSAHPESVDDLRVWPSACGRMRRKRVVADRAVRVDAGIDVQPVRVQVRRVRPVRHVHVAREAAGVDELDRAPLEELVEVPEDRVAAVGAVSHGLPDGLLHAAERRRRARRAALRTGRAPGPSARDPGSARDDS